MQAEKTRRVLYQGMKTGRGKGTTIPRKKRAKLTLCDEDNLIARRWSEREITSAAGRPRQCDERRWSGDS